MKLPWHKDRSPIRTVSAGPDAAPDGHRIEYVVLLLDRSPSMDARDYPPSRLEAAKDAVLAFYNAKRGIDPRDRVAVLQFDGGCQEVAGFGLAAAEVWRRVDAIRSGGSTAVGLAMQRGLELLGRSAPITAVRRMVVLSDGDTNTRIHPRQVVPQCRKERVIVDAVGIGSTSSADYRSGEQVLKEITAATGGVFVYCPDVQSLIDSYRRLAEKKAAPGILTASAH